MKKEGRKKGAGREEGNLWNEEKIIGKGKRKREIS